MGRSLSAVRFSWPVASAITMFSITLAGRTKGRPATAVFAAAENEHQPLTRGIMIMSHELGTSPCGTQTGAGALRAQALIDRVYGAGKAARRLGFTCRTGFAQILECLR